MAGGRGENHWFIFFSLRRHVKQCHVCITPSDIWQPLAKSTKKNGKEDRYNAEIRPICGGSLLTANVTTVCLCPPPPSLFLKRVSYKIRRRRFTSVIHRTRHRYWKNGITKKKGTRRVFFFYTSAKACRLGRRRQPRYFPDVLSIRDIFLERTTDSSSEESRVSDPANGSSACENNSENTSR